MLLIPAFYTILIAGAALFGLLGGLRAMATYCVPWTIGACGFMTVMGFTALGFSLGVILSMLIFFGLKFTENKKRLF